MFGKNGRSGCTVILEKEKEENSRRAEMKCSGGWNTEWASVEAHIIFLGYMTLGKLFNCPFFQFPFR